VAGRVGGSDGPRPLSWQDVRGGTRRRADELVCTEAEAAALEALRTANGVLSDVNGSRIAFSRQSFDGTTLTTASMVLMCSPER
jgi:hypothetical protein